MKWEGKVLKAARKALPALPVVLRSRPRCVEKKENAVHWEVYNGTEELSEINDSWFPTDRRFPETDFILKQWTQNLHRVFFTEVKIETAKLCLCMCMHMYQLSFLTWRDCKRNFHPDFSHPHGYRKKEFKGCWIYVSTVKFLSTEKYMLVKIWVLCNLLCECFQVKCYCTSYHTFYWVGVHLAYLWTKFCSDIRCAKSTLYLS